MRRESMERQAEERPARIFVHLTPGLRVRVNGCPGRITAVTPYRGGCTVTIEVNGSEGQYHPRDFEQGGIIELVATEGDLE